MGRVHLGWKPELGQAPDFKIYYVLPHYHELGTYFCLELVGGERDGEVVYEVNQSVGDWLGATFDPPPAPLRRAEHGERRGERGGGHAHARRAVSALRFAPPLARTSR